MPLWFFFAFIEIRTAYTELKACLDEQLSQTCKEYSNNQRLKGDIEKAATAVLRGRRFFCEAVNLRRIDLDFKVRPLVPCSREFFPEMEKCAKPIRNEYTAGNSASGELCRYLFSVLRMRALHPLCPSLSVQHRIILPVRLVEWLWRRSYIHCYY